MNLGNNRNYHMWNSNFWRSGTDK